MIPIENERSFEWYFRRYRAATGRSTLTIPSFCTRVTRMTLIAPTSNSGLIEEKLTSTMIGGFYDVYNGLGYGYLESNYANALELEFKSRGLSVAREIGVAVVYKGETVGRYRADMIVNGKVLVEVKSAAALSIADHKQVSNYLRATGLPIALLFHFGPKPAFHRTIQTRTEKIPFERSASSAQSA
jgi:GxxExxY protein